MESAFHPPPQYDPSLLEFSSFTDSYFKGGIALLLRVVYNSTGRRYFTGRIDLFYNRSD